MCSASPLYKKTKDTIIITTSMAMTINNVPYSVLSLLIFMFTLVQAEHPIASRRSQTRAFIDFQCQTTLYHDLCVRSLSYYVYKFTTPLSHQQLAQFALQVSLAKAKSTQTYVIEVATKLKRRKAKDYKAVKECLDQINDGVEQLSNSINETRMIKENGETNDFPWHASNVKTWMSTALTDASACVDRFSGRTIGGKTKAIIKAKVLNLQQVTSNALALFNRFAARYMSSHVKIPKV